jgi:hypothetical protein
MGEIEFMALLWREESPVVRLIHLKKQKTINRTTNINAKLLVIIQMTTAKRNG